MAPGSVCLVPAGQRYGLKSISPSESRCAKRQMNESRVWGIRPVLSAVCDLAKGGGFKGGGPPGYAPLRSGPCFSIPNRRRFGLRHSARSCAHPCPTNSPFSGLGSSDHNSTNSGPRSSLVGYLRSSTCTCLRNSGHSSPRSRPRSRVRNCPGKSARSRRP